MRQSYGIVKFPGVFGCVDGSHIPVQSPPEYEHEHVNRKNVLSINVQVICDVDMIFIDVVTKWPGSVHDARSCLRKLWLSPAKACDVITVCFMLHNHAQWLSLPEPDCDEEIEHPMMDTEVLTEVPMVLKKLVRMIARGFYTMEHAIVVDMLVRHPCIKEDDLADLLKYEKKHLRSLLNTLKNEKFLKSRMRVETDEEGRTTRHSYYFISYNVFVNVVKYKLDHIRKKIELEERTTSSRANFKCQACGKTFTDFEIGQLLDYTTKQLVCTFCEEEVLEDESSLPRADARTSLARFNSQVKPIFDLLQECEEIRLAPDLLEPEPTDFKKIQKNPSGPQQRTKGDNGIWSGDASRNIEFGYSDTSVTITVDDDIDKMAVEKKEVPIWMQKSTVDGVPVLDGLDSLPVGGKDRGPSRLISSTMVPSEDIMKTLLVHEPKAGSSRSPDHESSDKSDRDGFGAGTAPADDDDEEMESNEEDEAVPMVNIGDKRVPYHDVTEDMVALMSPLEKEEYIRIGQEIYENMYE